MDDFDDKSKQSGKLISFPNGEKVSTDELGSDYILDQSGVIPTPEVVDTVAIQRLSLIHI